MFRQIWSRIIKNEKGVALVVAILSFLVAIYALINQSLSNPKYALDVIGISSYSLVKFNENLSEDLDLRLLYKGQEVRSATVIEFTVVNTGNQPISTDNYETGLVFSTSPGSLIVYNAVVGKKPSDLHIVLTQIADNEIEARPALLNPGDKFFVRLIALNDPTYGKDFRVRGRIVGVREITYTRLIEVSLDDDTLSPIKFGPVSLSAGVVVLCFGLIISTIAYAVSRLVFTIMGKAENQRSK